MSEAKLYDETRARNIMHTQKRLMSIMPIMSIVLTLLSAAAQLNYEIRMLPVSMIAGVLGFRQREYLGEQAGKQVAQP